MADETTAKTEGAEILVFGLYPQGGKRGGTIKKKAWVQGLVHWGVDLEAYRVGETVSSVNPTFNHFAKECRKPLEILLVYERRWEAIQSDPEGAILKLHFLKREMLWPRLKEEMKTLYCPGALGKNRISVFERFELEAEDPWFQLSNRPGICCLPCSVQNC